MTLQPMSLHSVDAPGALARLHRQAALLRVDREHGELRLRQCTCNRIVRCASLQKKRPLVCSWLHSRALIYYTAVSSKPTARRVCAIFRLTVHRSLDLLSLRTARSPSIESHQCSLLHLNLLRALATTIALAPTLLVLLFNPQYQPELSLPYLEQSTVEFRESKCSRSSSRGLVINLGTLIREHSLSDNKKSSSEKLSSSVSSQKIHRSLRIRAHTRCAALQQQQRTRSAYPSALPL